ncbi:MAG: LamG domain-containing protein, partial [Gammaproteobacteria bacterium]|nr:LamG domain-containing protein [Gammaproteobacteria bacterium]
PEDWYIIRTPDAFKRFGSAEVAALFEQMISVQLLQPVNEVLTPIPGQTLPFKLFAAEDTDPGAGLSLVPQEQFAGVPDYYLLQVQNDDPLAPKQYRFEFQPELGRINDISGADADIELISGDVGAQAVAIPLGDIDGDGFAEFVSVTNDALGSPLDLIETNLSGVHPASVVDPTRIEITFSDSGQTVDLLLPAPVLQEGVWGSRSIFAEPGDYNGDGLIDIVVAVSLQNADSAALLGDYSAEGVYILFGREEWPSSIDLVKDADVVLKGFGERLPLSAANGGSLNGDQFDDLLVSVGGADPTVQVFNGRQTWPVERVEVLAADFSYANAEPTIAPTLDGALEFNGAADGGIGQSLTLPSAILNGATDLTIEFWMQTGVGDRTILSAEDNGEVALEIGYSGSQLLVVTRNTSGGQSFNTITTTTILNDTEWHHVAVTLDLGAGVINVYVDGQLTGTSLPGTAMLPTLSVEPGSLVVGQSRVGGFGLSAYTGQLDELRFWRTVRSAAEIADNYQAGLVGTEAGLQAYYRFNEGDASTLVDAGPYGFDGRDFGATTPTVTLPALALNGASDFTVEVAVRTTSSAQQWLLTTPTPAPSEFEVWLNGPTSVRVIDKLGIFDFNGLTNLADGARHDVSVVRNATAGQLSLYIDGVFIETQNVFGQTAIDSPSGLLVGDRAVPFGSAEKLSGQVDGIRFWASLRTAQEIAGLAGEDLIGDEAGLVAYYRFDDIDFAQVADASPGGLNGGVAGAPALPGPPGRVAAGVSLEGFGSGWELTSDRGSDPGHSSEVSLRHGPDAEFFGLATARTVLPLDLTGFSRATLSLNYFLDIAGREATDEIRVEISAPAGSVEYIGNRPTVGITSTPVVAQLIDGTGEWQSIEVDLANFLDETNVFLTLSYTSFEPANAGDFEGIYFDDIVISGTELLAPDDVLALPGEKGLSFDNDGLSVPDAVLNGRSDFTTEFRVRSDQPLDGQQFISFFTFDGLLIERFGVGGAGNALEVRYDNGALSGSRSFFLPAGFQFDDNQWHDYSVVYNGTQNQLSVYADGVLLGTQGASLPVLVTDGDANFIGNDPIFNAGFLRGDLSELRFWDSARSAADIAASSGSFLVGDETGLIAYYTLDTESGDVTADRSGNGLDAQLFGGSQAPTAIETGADYQPAPSVAGIGDVNGDGLDEFAVVSAPRGEVYVLPGTTTRYAELEIPSIPFPAPEYLWNFSTDTSNSVTPASPFLALPDGVLEGDAQVVDGQLILDGDGDYVNYGQESLSGTTGILSISATIRPTGNGSGGSGGGIIVNSEGSFEIARFADGTIRWAFANSDPGWVWVNTGYVAPLNQPTSLVVSYNVTAGRVDTYANGQLVHTRNISGAIGDVSNSTFNNNFWIGGRSGTSQFFEGQIDEVRLYRVALDAAAVAALAESLKVNEITGVTRLAAPTNLEGMVVRAGGFVDGVVLPDGSLNRGVPDIIITATDPAVFTEPLDAKKRLSYVVAGERLTEAEVLASGVLYLDIDSDTIAVGALRGVGDLNRDNFDDLAAVTFEPASALNFGGGSFLHQVIQVFGGGPDLA